MMAGFRKIELGELLSFANGRSSPDRADGLPFPVYGSNGIIGYADEVNADAFSIIIGRVGSYCGSLYLSKRSCWVTDNAIRAAARENNDPSFLFYLLRSLNLNAWRIGSGQPLLNQDILRRIPAAVPQPPEQRAIAGVLGALDDKIEHNQKTARALERLARTIFRAWFVDFDPVKAKAAGATSFPSMPQPTFDALPARFTDSEIGPVPEGWQVKAIGDVVAIKGGATPSTKKPEYWENGVHCWATPKDMSRLSHPVLLDTERRITDAGLACISSGLLPSETVLMSSRAPVGYLAIAGVPTAINQGFIAMVCDGPLPPTYVLQWAYASMGTIQGRASGTTFPEISKKNFRPLPVIVPRPNAVAAYRDIVDPLFDLLTATVKENLSLTATRDYLLPRLLNGSARVELSNG